MIAIDTNLLVFAHRMQVPEHRAARKAIEKASMVSDGWGFTLTNLLEFWSIVTHPAAPLSTWQHLLNAKGIVL